jgi:hypothetical protein
MSLLSKSLSRPQPLSYNGIISLIISWRNNINPLTHPSFFAFDFFLVITLCQGCMPPLSSLLAVQQICLHHATYWPAVLVASKEWLLPLNLDGNCSKIYINTSKYSLYLGKKAIALHDMYESLFHLLHMLLPPPSIHNVC